MFRSLFIGFLILSALTSKGAGVQINQNIVNIPTDMLLELFNAAVSRADKQIELSVVRPDGVFSGNNSCRKGEIEELMRPIRHDSPVLWIDQADEYNYSNLKCTYVKLQQKQVCTSDVYSCASDISPPNFRQVYLPFFPNTTF